MLDNCYTSSEIEKERESEKSLHISFYLGLCFGVNFVENCQSKGSYGWMDMERGERRARCKLAVIVENTVCSEIKTSFLCT